MTRKREDVMPLLIDRYLVDTTHLTTEQHGAYLLLLLSMWKHGGVLPEDEHQLIAITKLTPTRWKAHRDVLRAFFSAAGAGSITQKRLARLWKTSHARSDAGKSGAEERWQKGWQNDPGGDSKTTPNGMAKGTSKGGSEAPFPPSPPNPPGEPIPRARKLALGAGARGEIGQAVKRAGLDVSKVNLDDPRLAALLKQGATPAEFEGIAREAVAKGIKSAWGWVLKVVSERRDEAAEISQKNPANFSANSSAETSQWFDTESGLANRAAELGIGSYNDEAGRRGFRLSRERYRKLVLDADAKAREQQEQQDGSTH